MTPKQLRMARAAVRLGVRELAELAGVAPATLTRFETEKGGMNMKSAQAIQTALEGLGVQFLRNGDVAAGDGIAVKEK